MTGAGPTTDPAWVAELVASARRRVDFYATHLPDGREPVWTDLPTFHKGMLPPGVRFPLSEGDAAGAHRVMASSGTAGARTFVAFDERDWQRVRRWLSTVGEGTGLGPTDTLVNTHCYGLWVGGPALDQLAHARGAGLVPVGPAPAMEVVELLADGVGTAISTTPSFLRRIVEAAGATGIDLGTTGLRTGYIGAEPADQAERDRLAARLPDAFHWVELYGMTEAGGPTVAVGAVPHRDELVTNTDHLVVEVLDADSDRAVPLGGVGEVTLTTLAVDARTPLVRFRTRDLARAIATEGGSTTRISRIVGRVDDAHKVGGILVYPSAIEAVLNETIAEETEWRAVFRRDGADHRLSIEIEGRGEVGRAVAATFADRIGVEVEVRAVAEGALPRSAHKTRRVSLVDEALA